MKKSISLLLAISICLSITGCNIKKEVLQTNEELNIVLNTPIQYTNLINAYKRKYPNVKLTITDISSSGNDGYTDNVKTIITEIMAGKGPDIVPIDSTFASNLDIYKAMNSDLFADLTPYFDEDDSFDFSDYNEVMLEAGTFGEKRYIIPSYYSMHICLTTEETMKRTGFSVNNILDTKSFLGECLKVLNENKDLQLFSRPVSENFYFYPFYLGASPVNYSEETVDLSIPEIKEVAEKYKEIYQRELQLLKEDGETKYFNVYDGYNGLSSNRIILETYGYAMSFAPAFHNAMALESEGLNPQFIPIKNKDGKLCGRVTEGYAVNSSSPNKQNAVNFIKMLISSEWMSQDYEYAMDIPISKSATDIWLDRFTKDMYGVSGVPENTYLKGVPEELVLQYKGYIEEIDRGYFKSDWTKLYDEVMTSYYKDEISYEKAIKNVERKLELYVSE